MKTIATNLMYIGIEEGAVFPGGKRRKKDGLPVRKLGRNLPFLLGRNHTAKGNLQIYYSLLPEFGGRTLIRGRKRPWNPEEASRLAQRTLEQTGYCREHILAPELTGDRSSASAELLAARLYSFRPFERICLSLSEEGGEYQLEQAIEVITPYLPKIRQVLWIGGESCQRETLEDYLYEEFGLVMMDMQHPPDEKTPWIDLGDEETKAAQKGAKSAPNRLDCRGILKFLDTIVKNRYNTGVN